jgi:hypothetical protein
MFKIGADALDRQAEGLPCVSFFTCCPFSQAGVPSSKSCVEAGA